MKIGKREGLKAGRLEGIKALTETCRELGIDYEQTIQKVKIRFKMSQEDAKAAVSRYWK